MVRHFIIMSDSYSEHTRIALDILEKTQDDVNYITDIVLKLARTKHRFQRIQSVLTQKNGSQS